ncbi:DNA-directed RNA polymerase subunit beta [Paenalkalicoccus suaedae]|uniref:DNA-directed RNA polymerase subunit beta n=1 Tax=Paenalkalicoccus suaedae TaxID=2592382 RepID=A0A859FI32_9BACI|nr:DNA-directed RNA polymerase subunit beta [Paenalkalicoccus suaedae]QKS72739.1 DNA-directed RNA polymerase subunit beta [Paenalkalicoccus suaedae]
MSNETEKNSRKARRLEREAEEKRKKNNNEASIEESGDEEVEESKGSKSKKKPRKRKGRFRIIPIWIRIILVIAALLGSLVVGAMVGYGIVGEGDNPTDVLNPETWYHIYDIIFDGTQFERER